MFFLCYLQNGKLKKYLRVSGMKISILSGIYTVLESRWTTTLSEKLTWFKYFLWIPTSIGINDSDIASNMCGGKLGTYMKSHFKGKIIDNIVSITITLEFWLPDVNIICFYWRTAATVVTRLSPVSGISMKWFRL